jgi:predicted HTH transcriptional regulator
MACRSFGFRRAPRVTRVCADLDFGQELGEGIRRIYEEMRLSGLRDPVYTQTAASVRLLLSGEPTDRDSTPSSRRMRGRSRSRYGTHGG